tara:strand:+ start:177 stop:416 length:240 start_codon:yes stop_codon:yes gene_type:complete
MILGEMEYFCNCMLKNYKEHVTAPDAQGNCVYCGHCAVHRKIVPSDIRTEEKHGKKIDEKKREHLDMFAKDRRYDEKVN